MFQYGEGEKIGVPLPPYVKLNAEDSSTSYDKKLKWPRFHMLQLYIMVAVRPGIAFPVGELSRVMAIPCKKHWKSSEKY